MDLSLSTLVLINGFQKDYKNKTMKKIHLTLMLLISVTSLFGQRFSNGGNRGVIESLPIADIDIVTDNVLKFTRSTLPFFSDVNVIELDYQTANFFSSPALKINNSITPGKCFRVVESSNL